MLKPFNKFFNLLNRKEKNKILILIFLLFIGMSMEVLGIGLLLPFLEIISDENIVLKYPILEIIFDNLSITTFNGQVYFFLILIFIIYFLKAIYLIILSHKQFTFLQNLNARLSSELFNIYLNQPYISFTSLKTSNLIKHLTSDISFFYTFSSGVISFISETGLLLAIMIAIIYIDPFGALFIGTLFILFGLLFYFITKKKIDQWGHHRNTLLEKISKISLQGFNGFRELLIFNKVGFYTKTFFNDRFKLSKVQSKMSTLSVVPRHYLEFISIIIFIIFIIFSLFNTNDIKSLIPIIGVFIAASFKMIPSINKLIIASNNIKFYSNSIDIISEEFALKKNIKSTISSKEQEVSFSKRFEFKDLRFKYKDSEKIILDNINIEIKKGESVGIVGKSGAGKSTLIDLIVGILKPTTGTIIIDDKEYNSVPHNFKNQVSYISQDVFLFDGSIADNITMSNLNYTNNEKNKIIQSLKSADLYDMINKLPDGIDTMVGENGINLSGGQRQRIAIARALFRESKLLILDEATSNLDNVTEKKIMNSINTLKGKITMIIISHRLSILDCCDFIYEIKNNKLKKTNYEQSNISR